MAARKLQNEIDKCFKKVAEGVQQFESLYEKIQQASNPSQKEKLEDALKKEIKKLQRSRDQIKTWAASSDIKDKQPLLEHRKLIEQQMEKFKAVEKEMKTKAYSKEGLQAAAKLDPKEREKADACEFLQKMLEDLERQIEQLEAETETLQAGIKKGKKDTAKAERIAELERVTERHKWHINKLELLWRTLENGGVEVEQVKDLEDEIRYYVENNREVDFMENEEMYDDLNLQEEEEMFGMNNEMDRVSSQDTQSLADDHVDADTRPGPTINKPKSSSISESTGAARRPSTQLKSPLPALATLHTPSHPPSNHQPPAAAKPAPPPARTPGEPLKYASAAAAAAASDKSGLGLSPLPPPLSLTTAAPASTPAPAPAPVPAQAPAASLSAPPQAIASRAAPSASPSSSAAQPLTIDHAGAESKPLVPPIQPPAPAAVPEASGKQPEKSEPGPEKETKKVPETEEAVPPSTPALTNGDTHSEVEEEPIYHLPSSLNDLLESFEKSKAASEPLMSPESQKLFVASSKNIPNTLDAERPQHYSPQTPFAVPDHYPQWPLPVFDDQRLYQRCDTDMLFYSFYYKQGTYQQYCAAKALKAQSWRFHKQYQTWFQRHEEPKSITEDYEQGTYRFFDYESTWMNRRKADFKFHYKYLEDDL